MKDPLWTAEFKTTRFNITLKELEDAAQYARDNADNKYGTITIHRTPSTIGCSIAVSKRFDSEQTDITNTECW